MLPELEVTKWLGAGIVTLLGWMGIRLHARVDRLEREVATKEDLAACKVVLDSNHKDHEIFTRQMVLDKTDMLKQIRAIVKEFHNK